MTDDKKEGEETPLDIKAIHSGLRSEIELKIKQNEEEAILLRGALQGIDALVARLLEAQHES